MSGCSAISNAVPTMMTLNGQSFAQAFAGMYIPMCGLSPTCAGNTDVPVQPFFESALGGANSAFCKGFASCTAAVVANPSMNNFITQTQVFQLWSALEPDAPRWTLGRTHAEQPQCGDSRRPGVGHQRRRQLRLVQLQRALHHVQDAGLARRHDAVELHLGPRARYRQPVSGDFADTPRSIPTTSVNPCTVRSSSTTGSPTPRPSCGRSRSSGRRRASSGTRSADGESLRSSRLAAARRWQSGRLSSNESFGETQNSGPLRWRGSRRPRTPAAPPRIYNINIANSATGAGINGNTGQRRKQHQHVRQSGGDLQRVPALHPGLRHQLRIERPDSRHVELEYGSEHRQGHQPIPGAGVRRPCPSSSPTCSITSL